MKYPTLFKIAPALLMATLGWTCALAGVMGSGDPEFPSDIYVQVTVWLLLAAPVVGLLLIGVSFFGARVLGPLWMWCSWIVVPLWCIFLLVFSSIAEA
jgi:hypothetical protein